MLNTRPEISDKRMKAICITLALISAVLTSFAFHDSYRLTGDTLSSIGRYNPLWFMIWGFFVPASTFLCLLFASSKMELKHRGYRILIFLMIPFGITSTQLHSYEVMDEHLFFTVIFTLISALSFLLTLIYYISQKGRKRGYLYLIILSISGALNIWAILTQGTLLAIYQILFVLACLFVALMLTLEQDT